MKRILILPRNVTGITDVRQQEFYILNDVNYLEDITNYLKKVGKNPNNYKFCQFEQKATIPFFISIKDKLTNGYAEFEAGQVKFKDVPANEESKKQMIEQRHLSPINQNLLMAKSDAMELMLKEWEGKKVEELQKNQAIKKIKDVKKEVESFDYQKYLNEVV